MTNAGMFGQRGVNVQSESAAPVSEARVLANLQRIGDCADGKSNSIILYSEDCKALEGYMGFDKPLPLRGPAKREVAAGDVADKIMQMLQQTVTDQDVLITRLLDIVQMLAQRKS